MLIVKRSLDVQAAEWLLDAVLEGRLEPGKPVTEGILAQEMGLSRSTVRTALQRLCSDGLVVQRPYEGWEVLPLTASHVRDLYAVRTALETLAAKLAAKAVTARSRSDLADAMEALKRAIRGKKKRAIAEADLNVHLAIARASGNQRLITYCEQMSKSILLYIVVQSSHFGCRDAARAPGVGRRCECRTCGGSRVARGEPSCRRRCPTGGRTSRARSDRSIGLRSNVRPGSDLGRQP
jgi:DNA-binding GntR family transcriptional regulator